MELMVPDHIAYCFSAGRPIFLDTARNRYFTVPQRLADAFAAFDRGERTAELADAFEALARHGLLTRSATRSAPRTDIKPVRRSLAPSREPPVRLDDGFAVLWDVWRTARRLKRGPLTQILADLREQRPSPPKAQPDAADELLVRFLRHRSYVPIKANCLLDSIALLSFLRRHGGDAELVFGVTPSPFSAHCWLQRDDQVLNDTLDRVLPRIPIMVV